MTEIKCSLFNKVYKVKKVCLKRSEMPKNANYFLTVYTSDTNKTIYNIYMTSNGVLYAIKSITN
jgi:hypothetical protein